MKTAPMKEIESRSKCLGYTLQQTKYIDLESSAKQLLDISDMPTLAKPGFKFSKLTA